jgi:hypothetical protein
MQMPRRFCFGALVADATQDVTTVHKKIIWRVSWVTLVINATNIEILRGAVRRRIRVILFLHGDR